MTCITPPLERPYRGKILKSMPSSVPVVSKNRSTDSAPPQYSTVTHTTGLPTGKLQLAFPFTTSPRQRCTKPESLTELWNCRVSVSDAIVRQRSCCNNVLGLNVCAGFRRRNAAHSFNCVESHFEKRNVY